MKIRALIAAVIGLLCFLGASVSCGPSKAEREEAARQDSIRVADSIAKAEEDLRLAAIEAARQDSLARIEKFKQSLPSFETLVKNLNACTTNKIDFDKLGFKTIKRSEYWDGTFDGMEYGEPTYTDYYTYLFEVDKDHYCEIKENKIFEGCGYTLKIVGFPDILSDYKKQAKDLLKSGRYQNYGMNLYIEVKDNSIEWSDGA